jgi:hypothetical protein
MAGIASIGSRRQAILLGVLAVLLVFAVVRWRPGAKAPAPAEPAGRARLAEPDRSVAGAPPARGKGATHKEISPDEVPVLSVADFKPRSPAEPGTGGRDLFDLREPTHPPPPTPTPAPPGPGDPRFIGPLPLPPPPPPPRPPEITFKFIGTFGRKAHPIAVIVQADQVYSVQAGDTLFGKFVLRKVGYESIDVGFVGFPDSETRRVGIAP